MAASFPRLGVLWPNSTEVNSSLARYDYVVLGSYEQARIPYLKAGNPGILVLTTDNACEVAHGDLGSYPAQWLLTQVGSTLTASIDATSKTIPVGTTSSSGKKLFVAGDLVVIGSEVAYVEAVGTAAITVRRGAYRPAAAHTAGTRIAATLMYWPGTAVMDMSTYCPKVTLDPAIGPESWSDYKARSGAAKVSAAAWDGIYVDQLDGNKSYLVTGTFTPVSGRTIDPTRTNSVVTDSYAAFDAAWNAGLRLYEGKLRGLIGSHRVILGNGAWPNYDLLNGTMFERFPNASGGIAAIGWRDAVFTPDVNWAVATGKGSYTQWASAALAQNLTTVLTYQNDNGGADGKTPDYRNMRFALTTALMGDGSFTYRFSHDNRAATWFDEYDGAGRGRGYLGQPLGPASAAIPPATTPDLLSGDGAFDSATQLGTWQLTLSSGYLATKSVDTTQKKSGTSASRVDISQAGGVSWKARLVHRVSVTSGQPYTLAFWARADRPLTADAYVQRSDTKSDSFGRVPLDAEWRYFELPINSSGTDAAATLNLGLGEKTGTVWLDDVTIRVGNQRDVMRRDFQNGLALVNATDRVATIELGGTFRKIRGTQAPTVNDGSLVTAVTLQPQDGIVLLREGAPDTTAPSAPTGVSATAASTTSIGLSWTASTDASGIKEYRVYSAGALKATVAGTSATVTGLVPSTLYTFTVVAVDNAGNVSASSASASATTLADTTPPSTPSGVSAAKLGSEAVRVSWGLSTDASGIREYRVYDVRTDSLVATVTHPGTTATVAGLAPNTRYGYYVKAVDHAGKVSNSSQVAYAKTDRVVVRLKGADRFATAVMTSQEAYPEGAETVIVATGTNWPDALGGSALAGALDAPILLTRQGALPSKVVSEIKRLKATKAIVLGGTTAVSASVEASLKGMLGQGSVERIAGVNRYETANRIAARTIALLGDAYDGTAFVATGTNFPDALGASPLAAAGGWPIYLANPIQGANAGLAAVMRSAGITRTVVLGGTNVVAASVETSLRGLGTVTRLAGPNRYDTAVKVAAWGVENAGLSWDKAAVATGQTFPDALAGGVLQGASDSVMLLTPTKALAQGPAAALVTNEATIMEVRYLGAAPAVVW